MHDCNDNDFLFLAGFARPGGLSFIPKSAREPNQEKGNAHKHVKHHRKNMICDSVYVMHAHETVHESFL